MHDLQLEWERVGKPKVILACSSCYQVFKANLPNMEIIPLWELLDEYHLYPPKPTNGGREFVIHDPCTTRHETRWQGSSRKALDRMGYSFHELEYSRDLTECCGYGGVAWLAHPELVHDIVQRRVHEDETDYLTYCVMCRDLFAAEGKRTLHLLDLVYGQDLDALSTRKGPDYTQRHENRIRARYWLQKHFLGKEEGTVESYEKYHLLISPDVRAALEKRLILAEDIQKVIGHAVTSKEWFANQDTGHNLAYFKPNLITYWVEYTVSGEVYQIFDAYSHRMDFQGDNSV